MKCLVAAVVLLCCLTIFFSDCQTNESKLDEELIIWLIRKLDLLWTLYIKFIRSFTLKVCLLFGHPIHRIWLLKSGGGMSESRIELLNPKRDRWEKNAWIEVNTLLKQHKHESVKRASWRMRETNKSFIKRVKQKKIQQRFVKRPD